MHISRGASRGRGKLAWIGVALAFGGAQAAARTAHAAGVEDTVTGGVALGRAANYARVNDFMATTQNPANLAVSGGNVGLELRVPFFTGCFDREPNGSVGDPDGDGNPGVTYKPSESFDEVCNDASPFPSGNLGAVIPLWKSLTLGAGIFTPAGVGTLSFGDDRIVTSGAGSGETLPITTTGKQSPNRALLIEREVLAAFLTVGLGYAPIEQLRFGASFGWGFADVKYKNAASLLQGFTDPEVINDVNVRDNFVPRATVSVAGTPMDALDLVASFTYTGDISADGYVDVTANGIKNAPLANCRDADPGSHCRVDDVTLNIPYQRYELVLGARYASRRVGRENKKLDPIADEVWDVEIDGQWSNTGRVDEYSLDLYTPLATDAPNIEFSSDPTGVKSPLPPQAGLPHRWRDTYAVRFGGDYNVLANKLAVRAGVSYESRGVPVENMNIDYWPVAKLGVHVGATWRVGPMDLHVAYAHLFNETITVPVGKGAINEVTAIAGNRTLGVNEGTFTSHQDIVSLQGNYRF